jgi:hypothetical protein
MAGLTSIASIVEIDLSRFTALKATRNGIPWTEANGHVMKAMLIRVCGNKIPLTLR